MSELLPLMNELRRPRLLVRAARAGLERYNRNRDLKRLMRLPSAPGTADALHMLLDEEARVEEDRRAGRASYSFVRHLELLIAMMAEARLLPRPEGA
ncbi:MAG: DUF6477 family protein [Paracoccaceae bacterium]